MNILNSNEAFAAMMAGKNILCRAAGELIEFDDLDQFPATIFAKAGYEFCIKIEMMELGGISFTKPLTLDEIQDGQDVFTINTYGQSIYISEFGKMTCPALIESINSGFVQRDAENAKLQLQAMAKVLGRELNGDCLVVRLGTDKPKRNTGKKANNSTPTAANDASVPVEKKTSCDSAITNEPEVWKTSAQEAHETLKETREIAEAFMASEPALEGVIETEAVKLIEKFTTQIAQCNTVDSVLGLRSIFLANGHLEREDHQHLCKLTEDKLLELDPEQYAPKSAQIVEHQEYLDTLLNDVALAQTPVEVNALIRYTKTWTEQQRKPVIMAMNKRLIELSKQNTEVTVPPSLMVRIQNAVDIAELYELEAEVRTRHPDIQPKLMDVAKQRRFELENQVDQVELNS
ncbi:hypothetical protein [Acinetobacter sp. ANC 4648]|uniref:hypothetical protein n=1 Tax=Acinetobacter sp. ANC 4648 TaxID=1977875 RepID=UPI000A33277E|nr:hypothetical protein [Acinetobacter sp. ANC 4648]OTG81530.1 hypothetical protein B9T27_09610 [Acinetobacter sp. ANC 4648]